MSKSTHKHNNSLQQRDEDYKLVGKKSRKPKSRAKRSEVKNILKRGNFEKIYDIE